MQGIMPVYKEMKIPPYFFVVCQLIRHVYPITLVPFTCYNMS